MKKFIINFIKFILGALFIVISVVVLSVTVIKKNAIYKIPSQPKYIVVGHSHPECAFNDSLISNFKNISLSGESYFHIYQEIQPILNQNPSIKVVFIEYTNNQITKRMNGWIWDNKYMSRNPERLAYMGYEDIKLLLCKNTTGFINLSSLATKLSIFRAIKNNFNFSNDVGGYLYLIRDKTDSILRRQNDKNTIRSSTQAISEYHLNYLSKIISYCRNKDVTPILIRSPLHKSSGEYINEKEYIRILKNRFSSIGYLDFSKFPLQNSEFGDLEHLNYKGARKFSIWFNNLMDNGLLTVNDKQVYLKNEIEKVRTHNKAHKSLVNKLLK